MPARARRGAEPPSYRPGSRIRGVGPGTGRPCGPTLATASAGCTRRRWANRRRGPGTTAPWTPPTRFGDFVVPHNICHAGRIGVEMAVTNGHSFCNETATSGGAEGIRTPGLLIANETRYQLRHSPGGQQGSNPRCPPPPGGCRRSSWSRRSGCSPCWCSGRRLMGPWAPRPPRGR